MYTCFVGECVEIPFIKEIFIYHVVLGQLCVFSGDQCNLYSKKKIKIWFEFYND